MSEDATMRGPDRRAVLGAGVTCAAIALLGGCSSRGGGAAAAVPSEIKGKVIAKTSDIPVGGGKIFPQWQIVVTQPTAGEFRAFSAVCTHQGCTVGQIADGLIMCPCHGSEFAVADGSVRRGPAATPLARFPVRVVGDGIAVG